MIKIYKTKRRRDLYIEDEVFEHSKKNVTIKSLSEWVNQKYSDEFMSLQKIKENIHINMCIKKRLENEFNILKSTPTTFEVPQEVKVQLPGLKKKIDLGYEKKAILRRLNNDYNLGWSMQQFDIIMDDVDIDTSEQ